MKDRVEITEVLKDEEYRLLGELFREYEKDLGFALHFQHFSEELASLQEMYGPPEGAAFILKEAEVPFGCVAVRKLETGIAEIKRMFIKKPWRGKGYGKLLLELSLKASEKMDYEKVRLDTLDYMAAAIHTYRQAGFYEIPPYRHNPFQNAVFMEKQL
jgi:GNAT superfamily N-acetyltransferase